MSVIPSPGSSPCAGTVRATVRMYSQLLTMGTSLSQTRLEFTGDTSICATDTTTGPTVSELWGPEESRTTTSITSLPSDRELP